MIYAIKDEKKDYPLSPYVDFRKYEKRSWNNCNKILVIQRRVRVVTDYKNRQKVCLVHYN